MGSLENGAIPLTKRDPLLKASSLRPRPYRSRLARFLLFEKLDHFHLLCVAALFFSVVFLFGFFLPGSVTENPVRHADPNPTEEVTGLWLDFGEGIRFEPVKLLESWEKERREETERLSGLERQVLRVGVRRPILAMVFGDLLLDEIQLEMVSVGAALKECGYDIEVFSFEGGPAGTIWRSLSIPVHNLSINSIDWLDFNGILVNSLLSRPIFSILLQEPFKSVPVIWTIHERHLADNLNYYFSNGLNQIIHEWNRTLNRASVIVFHNYILPLIYSPFDNGNFYVIPGSPLEVIKAEKILDNNNINDMRQNYGLVPDDFIITIVGSQFWYSGVLIEHALILKALYPLLQQFSYKNSLNSHLKIRILSSNLSESYNTAIETIALKVGFPNGVVGHFGNFDKMQNMLSISDIVIYGSFLEEQAFPSVLIQAMSLNKLIIAPNLSMIINYVENGVNGYIYQKENTGELTKIIGQTLSENKKLSLFAKRIASIGKNHAKNLMASQTIQGYITLLDKVIKFPSETGKPNPGNEIPDLLRAQWQWGLVENYTGEFCLEERGFGELKSQQGQSGNFSENGDVDAFAAIVWEEEKKVEMENVKRRLEEEEIKERSEQAHGTWEEVYRNVKKADRAKNELHERDDKELERTGQPLTIYEPYFGEATWTFLHKSALYRGIGLGTRGRRPGLDDIDASSRLPLLNEVYYRDLLAEFGAFFAIANRIDRVHKNAWIGFQSWRASAKQGGLSKDAELAMLKAIQEQKHGDALYFWVRMDQDLRNPSKLDFWSFCDSINAGNCRYVVKKALRRMYNIKNEDKDILPPMHGETWSVMQSWVVPTRSFLEFVMFSRMFVDALDAEMYDPHHETGHCYLSTHKDPHCYSRVLELLINIWAYHSVRRIIYIDPFTGSMQEFHNLTSRKHQMQIKWFSYQTLKGMDEDLAEEFDSDRPDRRWIWPKTGEVYWQGVLERERNMRIIQKEKRKQQSKDKIERIKKRARQKTIGKFIKPPPEEENNSTRTD